MRKWVLLFLAVSLVPLSLKAATVLCGRYCIAGFTAYHDKALLIFENDKVSDPRKMSVYVAVTHTPQGLYLQSNYYPPGRQFPNKLWTDNLSLEKAVYYLGDFAHGAPFDRGQLIYYVEPSFFQDPIFSAYQNQLVGRVVHLAKNAVDDLPPVAVNTQSPNH